MLGSGDTCSGSGRRLRAVILVSGGGIGYRRKRSRRSDAMRADYRQHCTQRGSSVGQLSAVWVVGMLAAGGQCLQPVAVSAGVAVAGRSVGGSRTVIYPAA